MFSCKSWIASIFLTKMELDLEQIIHKKHAFRTQSETCQKPFPVTSESLSISFYVYIVGTGECVCRIGRPMCDLLEYTIPTWRSSLRCSVFSLISYLSPEPSLTKPKFFGQSSQSLNHGLNCTCLPSRCFCAFPTLLRSLRKLPQAPYRDLWGSHLGSAI